MYYENDLTTELLKALYVFSTSLGLWTCLSIFINKRCPVAIKHSLLLFIGILLVMPINAYLSLILLEPPLILSAIASTLTWCYGPLILLLVNNTILKEQSKRGAYLHFIPFLIASFLFAYRLDWLSFNIYYTVLITQVLIYLTKALFTIYQYKKRIALLGREFKFTTYYWLLYLVAGLFAILVYENALVIVVRSGLNFSSLFVAITVGLFSLYISTISIILLFKPDLFNSRSNDEQRFALDEAKPQADNKPVNDSTNENLLSRQEKQRNIELSDDAAEELAKKLSFLMEEKKLHLDPDINLSKLATDLEISNHQLSELLNIHLETSFYDYLNSHRYQEAIQLMCSDPKQHSVTDIAFLSGFNNRNSFYRVFKENSGLTPGEYRKRHSIAE